jgi:hypothetical protein
MSIPAFPVNKYEGSWVDGMDLRDYFAAKAMQAFITCPQGKFPHQTTHEIAVEDSYTVADAMMKAREE